MSKHAYVFPGQGSQFSGMGKNLYESNATAKEMFEKANEILGFRISDIMFEGTDEQLKQTNVTQPAIFIHSVIAYLTAPAETSVAPDMVAGHSLGEFSALVANKALSFEDALRLVSIRAKAMQAACMALARILTKFKASWKLKVLLATNALNSPKECPATISGATSGIVK